MRFVCFDSETRLFSFVLRFVKQAAEVLAAKPSLKPGALLNGPSLISSN